MSAPGTYAATFSNNVYIPEYAFVIFQMTFACITPALIIGAFAERIKFWPLMLFVIGWSLLAYYPIAHMVWFWAGPDFLVDFPADMGLLWGMGALDFAGGTVVHINAGIAGLIGCLVIGPRIGHNKEPMPPHSLTLTMVGASLLWVGWFGFNAGSNLESNGITALAFLNTFVATAAATVSWCLVEQLRHGRPSLLGAVTGAVAGLVAITPACGFASPGGALVLGLIVSPICYTFVSSVKKIVQVMTTALTSSASIASAGSSVRSAPASWPIRQVWVVRAGSTIPCSRPWRAPTTWRGR